MENKAKTTLKSAIWIDFNTSALLEKNRNNTPSLEDFMSTYSEFPEKYGVVIRHKGKIYYFGEPVKVESEK